MQDEITYPARNRNEAGIGPLVLMVAMEEDVGLVRGSLGIKGRPAGRIMMSRLYRGTNSALDITVVGPMLGAPQAVMIQEKLIVLGAKKIIFLGWCGAIDQGVRIADFIVPDCALIGDGTSRYYTDNRHVRPSKTMVKRIEEGLATHSIPFHKGAIWSTDAPYRETRRIISSLQKKGALGVDMEVAALFSAALFRKVEVGALLVVSDELGSLQWRRGFSSGRFKKSRRTAAQVLQTICENLIRDNKQLIAHN